MSLIDVPKIADRKTSIIEKSAMDARRNLPFFFFVSAKTSARFALDLKLKSLPHLPHFIGGSFDISTLSLCVLMLLFSSYFPSRMRISLDESMTRTDGLSIFK